LADTTLLLSQFYIKFDGTDASEPMMLNLVEATVENSLHLPDVATLTFHDPDGKWVDDSNVSPGKALTISAKVMDTTHQLFDGEVVELESDFFPGERRLVVRAFGYRPSTSKVFRVPPPVTGLRLALVPDPRQQAKLIRLAGRVGALRVGAHIRPGTRVAGLKLRIVRRRLRGITVLRRTYRTAFGIGLRSTLKALRQAYPGQAAKVRIRTRGVTTIRVQHVTFSVRRGVVTAIVVR